mmetsp:Transcript_54271/g.117378  ORF Transcript_54271/g.117378 Transcript_54271/m.117378 type:complete len:231 (+) Transcript_54271:451-1143(+)
MSIWDVRRRFRRAPHHTAWCKQAERRQIYTSYSFPCRSRWQGRPLRNVAPHIVSRRCLCSSCRASCTVVVSRPARRSDRRQCGAHTSSCIAAGRAHLGWADGLWQPCGRPCRSLVRRPCAERRHRRSRETTMTAPWNAWTARPDAALERSAAAAMEGTSAEKAPKGQPPGMPLLTPAAGPGGFAEAWRREKSTAKALAFSYVRRGTQCHIVGPAGGPLDGGRHVVLDAAA